ncbi:RNA-binding domain-containing protein [Violaceomyces palustris]|uniref:RNA-binding domain-containing protein n=1 Tax=Violaceomyces palustris TaxID=1673888 RepID=A0ACD0NVR1_9BASI|nr:RNA-binding domain-containing protein [Violaceomyces palustris]
MVTWWTTRKSTRGRSYNNSQASRTPSPRRGSISRSLSRSLSRSRSRSRSLVSSRSGSSSGHHGRYDSDSRSDTHPQVSKVRGNRRSSRKGEGEGEEELHTVMVKGLTKNVEEYHLEEIFGFYGRIQSVHLPIYRRSGENKSYAQIVYSKPSMAQKAVEHMDKGQIDGSLLTVSLCEEPDLRGSQRRRSRSPLEIERHPYARQPFSKREEVVERSDEWRRGDFGKGGYERGTSQRRRRSTSTWSRLGRSERVREEGEGGTQVGSQQGPRIRSYPLQAS